MVMNWVSKAEKASAVLTSLPNYSAGVAPLERSAPASRAPFRRARASSNASMASLEQSIFRQINQYRQTKGLAPLTLNVTITQQARRHSQAMANSRALSHNGFSGRVQTIGRSIPYRAAAENVSYNSGFSNPDVQSVSGWIKSTGHRLNIEGNYNLTGIGAAKNSQGEFFFTQIFIRR